MVFAMDHSVSHLEYALVPQDSRSYMKLLLDKYDSRLNRWPGLATDLGDRSNHHHHTVVTRLCVLRHLYSRDTWRLLETFQELTQFHSPDFYRAPRDKLTHFRLDVYNGFRKMTLKTKGCEAISLTDLPLEVLSTILDQVYEGPQNLTITNFHHFTIKTTTSTLPITPLLLNRHIHSECLDAIRRSTNNIITLKLQAGLADLSTLLQSPTFTSFLPTITTLNLPNFPYDSAILTSWKETCPNLRSVIVSHAYSSTTNPTVHATLMTSGYTALLRGDTDTTFADAAIKRILAVHPTFRLSDIPDELSLTFPNLVSFWSPYWERKYYHENRVLVLSLTITKTKTYVSGKSFQTRIRNVEYKPQAWCRELPRFSGVDYEVKYVGEGTVEEPDYDPVNDCFRTPYW